jgi:hypothetical protein
VVDAMATFDDGEGPALRVGGLFQGAGEVAVNRVACWDGNAWAPLSGLTGTGDLASSVIAAQGYVPEFFADGFEQGATSSWSLTVPARGRGW